MLRIADAAASILAIDGPVLFLDTCVLLDVIRATMDCMGTDVVPEAVRLLGLLQAVPPACVLVVASFVPTEWNDNASKIRGEAHDKIAKVQKQAEHFHAACDALGVVVAHDSLDFHTINLHDRLFILSQAILDTALVLSLDRDCSVRAMGRVLDKRAPSRRGNERNDSVIVEECLELTRQLRERNFRRKCVFCTSNIKDYGHPDQTLGDEFAMVGLTFTSKLPWAVHELTSP